MNQERQARLQMNAERGILSYAEIQEMFAALDAARAESERLARERDAYKGALEFYAERLTWAQQPIFRTSPIEQDCGDTARATLAAADAGWQAP